MTFEKNPRLSEKMVSKQALTLGGGGWETVLGKNVDLVFFFFSDQWLNQAFLKDSLESVLEALF